MTIRELEKEIWTAKGMDPSAVDDALRTANPFTIQLDAEIEPELLPVFRARMTQVIDTVIADLNTARSN